MLNILLCALRAHRWLALLGAGFILSSLGNGLTYVIVFGELLHMHAAVSSLTLAYLLSTLPGWLGSQLGERLCRHLSPFQILIAGEMLGLGGLILPAYGVLGHSIPLLLSAQCISALTTGMTLPAISMIFKRGLSTEELGAATCLETLIFASHVLLGVGAGVLLYPLLPPLALIGCDVLSFVLSAGLLLLASQDFSVVTTGIRMDIPAALPWSGLVGGQKRSILLLPVLALVGTPAMALLPALVTTGAGSGYMGLSLLFARSLGQLLGPLLLSAKNLRDQGNNNRSLLLCLTLFIISYVLATLIPGWLPAMMLIFIAHLASNRVFALGMFGLLDNFGPGQVSLASAKAYRWQLLVTGVMSLLAGMLADRVGAAVALYLLSGGGMIGAILGLPAIGRRQQ